MKTLLLASILLLASTAIAQSWSGDYYTDKTPCFKLKAGKKNRYHYTLTDDGGYQALISIYLGRCGKGLIGMKQVFRKVVKTSEPYFGEGDFRVTAPVDGRYYFRVNAAGDWTIDRIK